MKKIQTDAKKANVDTKKGEQMRLFAEGVKKTRRRPEPKTEGTGEVRPERFIGDGSEFHVLDI